MNTPNVKGRFTITCIDESTGEKRTLNKSNTVVGLIREHIPKDAAATGLSDYKCHYSDELHVPGSNRHFSFYMKKLHSTVQGIVTADPAVADSTDYYIERTFRFDSTGTANTINTITVDVTSGSNKYVNIGAYTVLNSPFVQGTNEVMDITYRLTFNTTTLPDIQAIKWANFLDTAHNKAAYTNIYTRIIDTHIPQSIIDSFISLSVSSDISLSSKLTESRTSVSSTYWTSNLLKTDLVGSCLKSIVQIDQSTNTESKLDGYCKPTFSNPVLKDNSVIPSYPLSPLFNHSWDAGNIFEDISHLATGLGYPIVSSSSPTYLDGQAQEQYIFNITKSGNTGIARYDIVYKSTVGSVDANNNVSVGNSNLEIGLSSAGTSNYTGLFHTSLTDKSIRYLKYATLYFADYDITFGYNADWLVCLGVNDTTDIGILFINRLNPELTFGFDPGTTPPLVTGLKRAISDYDTTNSMCRDNAGSLYVCVKTGLMKITDPLGTPTISYWSLVDIGITTEPYAVDIIDSTLGILNDTGVSISTNLGSTWTNHTITRGAYTGLTVFRDSNFVGLTKAAVIGKMINLTTDTTVYTPSSSLGVKGFLPIPNSHWVVSKSSNGTSSPKMGFIKDDGTNYYSMSKANTVYYMERNFNEFIKDGLGNYLSINVLLNTGYNTSSTLNMDRILIKKSKDSIIVNGEDSFRQNQNVNSVDHSELDGIPYTKASMTHSEIYYNNKSNISYRSYNEQSKVVGNIFHTPEHEKSLIHHYKANRAIIHRWNGASWVAGYNKATDATGDGSYVLTAIRRNFDTDSNRFNSGCSLDISAAVNSAIYSTNGMMIIATATAETKNVGGFNGTDWAQSEITLDSENPITCLFEVTDTATNKSVALLTVGYNNKTVLVDSTNPTSPVYHDLEVQPVNGQYRYAMSISSDGLTVKVYRNASQLGTTTTLGSALNMNATYEVTVGSRNRCPLDGVHNLGANYKGKIENIQVFKTILTSGELSNDSGTPLGLTAPTINLIVRYLMTMDYGEGRVTHATTESTMGGVDISFPDGDLSNDSYVKSDNYLCYKIKDGFIKDNTSTFDLKIEDSTLGHLFNTVTSPIDGSSTIPSTSSTITEQANFNTLLVGDSTKPYGNVKDIYLRSASYINLPVQSSTVDFTIEFTSGYYNKNFVIRVGDINTIGSASYATHTNFASMEMVQSSRDIKLYDETGTTQTISAAYTINTKFKFEWIRSTGIAKLFKWDGSSWVQLGVDIALSSANAGTVVTTCLHASTACSCEILNTSLTYTPDNRLMRIGDKATATGAYSDKFLQGTQFVNIAQLLRVDLDGVAATQNFVAINTASFSSTRIPTLHGAPPVGSYNYYPQSGTIEFNSADAGKVVTINDVYLEML